MTFTDHGTKVSQAWLPLAMANGLEWSHLRRGKPDRFDCLYRHGRVHKLLWYIGAVLALAYRPAWLETKR